MFLLILTNFFILEILELLIFVVKWVSKSVILNRSVSKNVSIFVDKSLSIFVDKLLSIVLDKLVSILVDTLVSNLSAKFSYSIFSSVKNLILSSKK